MINNNKTKISDSASQGAIHPTRGKKSSGNDQFRCIE